MSRKGSDLWNTVWHIRTMMLFCIVLLAAALTPLDPDEKLACMALGYLVTIHLRPM